MTFKSPYLTYRDIGKYAEDFLTKYHPGLELPIPIEETELNFKISLTHMVVSPIFISIIFILNLS